MPPLLLFLKSASLGLAVAAPVGPMALLCMRRTLAPAPAGGWRAGLATGLGIASGDALYATVAGLGLSGISLFLDTHQAGLHLLAGLVLVWLGLSMLRRPATTVAAGARGGSLARIWAGTVLLTLTNPPTILIFAALLASLAPPGGLSVREAVLTTAGVASGSAVWWCALVAAIALFGRALGPRTRRWIDRLSGLAIAGYGALELLRAF